MNFKITPRFDHGRDRNAFYYYPAISYHIEEAEDTVLHYILVEFLFFYLNIYICVQER